MAKTSGKIWQAKHREKLKQNEEAYQSYLEKVQLCKKLQREKDKNKPLPEKEAHKVAERHRIRSYFIKKKKREQIAFPQTFTESPFQTKQSLQAEAPKWVAVISQFSKKDKSCAGENGPSDLSWS